ncbi:MAG: hypothetical protein EU529_07905 [Promethearchaeota archaeon]|nr:MAG: hypothetical protein EU529_07905 [Candidatus Lokiarchaeota archaeon]
MKFVTDAMFGRLTRFLRIFGYDTVYANDLEDYFQINPVPDDKLLEYAEQNNRIIITKDYLLHKKNRDKSILLEGEGVYNYLKQLKIKLDLSYNFKMKKARCSKCNFELTEVDNKNSIKNLVEPETFKYNDDFYQCTNSNCKKIYWKGTHIENIVNKLKKMNI